MMCGRYSLHHQPREVAERFVADPTLDFERLELTVEMIATHRDYPGKQEVIRECRDDIEGRWREGRLSSEQRDTLVALLPSGQPGPTAYARLA
jgi:hypothetical protein